MHFHHGPRTTQPRSQINQPNIPLFRAVYSTNLSHRFFSLCPSLSLMVYPRHRLSNASRFVVRLGSFVGCCSPGIVDRCVIVQSFDFAPVHACSDDQSPHVAYVGSSKDGLGRRLGRVLFGLVYALADLSPLGRGASFFTPLFNLSSDNVQKTRRQRQIASRRWRPPIFWRFV